MIQELDSILSQNDIQSEIEEIINKNKENKIKGWKESMDYLYNFSINTGYIQEERLKLNIILPLFHKHQYDSIGFQVTINCSKPEIIVGQAVGAAHYSNFEGQCVICFENVGSEKRKGLRAYEFKCNKSILFRQFPPYPYFNYHNIIIDKKHTPQILSRDTIIEMLEMSESMPGYKIASNTDRVGTGATNLTHRHFQAGDHDFTVFHAKPLKEFKVITGKTTTVVQWLNYPCCCLKVIGENKKSIEEVVFKLFDSWRNGTYETLDPTLQTCSLMSTLNVKTNCFEFLIFPRNAQQPRFLTSSTLQCIKKEFVGIFELCGFAILPGRLKEQLLQLDSILLSNDNQLNNQLKEKLNQIGFIEFFDWLSQYYFNGFDNTKSIYDNLTCALQKSFLTILSDNSPISLNQSDLLDSWIKQSKI
ncbi:hypothetical protein RB653_006390 [Dictyostelium firmibasis]|uniref:DUF4922 domain-containing protein n=1 Tax=Dictyostelium firmibasis TaxID=79012 RepID=A0AAN7UDC0_9MYCE